MFKKQPDEVMGSWSTLKVVLIVISTLLILVVVAGGIFFFDIVYTTLVPPVSSYERVPIDLTKANSVSTTSIHINYNRKYDHFRFYLVFELEGEKDQNRPTYPVEKREQLAKFVGWVPPGPGVKFPVKLTVTKVNNGKQVTKHDKIYYTEGCRAMGSDDFFRQITVLHLKPGNYVVRLENLKEVASVPDGVTVALEVVQFGAK